MSSHLAQELQLKDLGRALAQLRDVATSEHLEVDKDTVEGCVSGLFRRAAQCVTTSRVVAELCCSELFRGKEASSLPELLASAEPGSNPHVLFYVTDYLLTFLKKFYLDVRTAITTHLPVIVGSCRSLLTATVASKTRCAAAELIKYIVKHYPGVMSPADVQLHALVAALLSELNSSKCTQSAKGAYLELLGTLFGEYTTDMQSYDPPLRLWIEAALDKQFSSATPEMTLISGCFLCLNQLLKLDATALLPAKRDQLFAYIQRSLATTAAGAISRLTFVKSCLVLLRHHAALFQPNLASDPFEFYALLRFCCLHSNKTIRKPGYDVLPAVLETTARELGPTGSAPEAVRKRQFQRFLKEFLSNLNDADSLDKPCLALTGLAAFAPLLEVFLDAVARGKIYARLVKYGEDVLALRDSHGSKWLLLCQYAVCFGRFASEMEAGDVAIESFAADLGVRVLDMYPHTAMYMKYRAELALQSLAAGFPTVFARIVRHGMLLVVSNQVDVTEATLLYHPETGAPDTRLLFVYEGLWNRLAAKVPAVFEASMAELLTLLRRLDLRYRAKSLDDDVGDDAVEFEPLVPRDHTILLNLTEFTERWLTQARRPAFVPWVPLVLEWVAAHVASVPLVSAVYRLGRLCSLALADESAAPALQAAHSQFVAQVVAALEHFRDELLLAASLCVLATPPAWADAQHVAMALRHALALGLQHTPTAEIALSTLEVWQPSGRLASMYPALLPLLGPYLEAPASPLQRRLLRWLGALGGHARFVLPPPTGSATALLAPLELELALTTQQLHVSVTALLEPLMELARRSIDRELKAAAAEALHAVALLLVGKTATLPKGQSHTSEKTAYFGHWRALFPAVLALATDGDSVVRTLFHTLLFQLVRWFSGVAELFPFEVQALVDAVLAALADVDGGGRDIAADAVAVLLMYAAKQPDTSLVSAAALFDQLFALSTHPSLPQRLGSALAVERAYRDFREDPALVQRYALGWTKHALLALKLQSNALPVNHVTTQRLVRATAHLEKILARCHAELQAPNVARAGDADCVSLPALVAWLFAHVGSPQTAFRARCRSLFMVLARLNAGGSCHTWLAQHLKERSPASVLDSLVPPEIVALQRESQQTLWCDTLAAAAETVAWLAAPTFNARSLVPDSLWATPSKKRLLDDTAPPVDQPTRLWAAIARFVESTGTDGDVAARSRAFTGICRLVVVAVAHADAVPTLADQWQRSQLAERLMTLLVLARLDPRAAGLQPLAPDAEDVWRELSGLFLRHLTTSIAYRSVLRRFLNDDSAYARSGLLTMDPAVATGVCALHSSLHALRYWGGLEDEALGIGNDFGRLAMAYFSQPPEQRRPMTDHVVTKALETAATLGFDLPAALLQATPTAVHAVTLPRLEQLINRVPGLWLPLVQRALAHVSSHRVFLPLLEMVLAQRPPTPAEVMALEPDVMPFAVACFASADPAILAVLHRLLGSVAPGSELAALVHGCLASAMTPAPVKAAVLRLVPAVVTPEAVSKLADAVHFVVVHDFPLVSTDVAPGSLAHDTYQALFTAVVDAFVGSHRLALLPPLYASLKEGAKHALARELEDGLAAFCAAVPSTDVAVVAMDALHVLFDAFVAEAVRWRVFLEVAVPLVRRLPAPEAFFTRPFQGAPLVATLVATLDRLEVFPQRVAFGLLETLYEVVPADALRQHVNGAFCPGATKGNELTMRLCKAASLKVGTAAVAVAAYRCLLMTVRQTQTQEKFYTQLLFPDSMWSTLLDDASFMLSTEATWASARRTTGGSRRLASISSQFLEGSSLSQTAEEPAPATPDGTSVTLSLEADPVNQHPCMAPLMRTLVAMEALFQAHWSPAVMPAWMEKLRQQLQYHPSVVVRVFVARIVLNRPGLFAPYAAQWIAPLTEAMVVAPATGQFHYLLRDVCHLLLTPPSSGDITLLPWTTAARGVASDMSPFVNHLMRVAAHASAWILRDNLYLIETALSTWPCYTVDMASVLALLAAEAPSPKETAAAHTTGLQLTAMLLSLGFASSPRLSYQTAVRSVQPSLEAVLLSRMRGQHKATPTLASDVAGLLLSALPSPTFEAEVVALLKEFFQEDKPHKFLNALKALAAHVPALVDDAMLNRLQAVLPRVWVHDGLTATTVDLLVHAVASPQLDATTMFLFLRPHLPKLLRHRAPGLADRLLAVVEALWPELSETHRALLLSSSEDTSLLGLTFDAPDTRRHWLEFLMTSGCTHEPAVQARLLRGLTDADDAVRAACAAYWNQQLPPTAGPSRILALCGPAFKGGDAWVRFVPRLWLDAALVDNPQLLFSAPLSAQVAFEPMAIDTAWAARTQHSLTPLFSQDAVALQTQPLAEQQARLVKATQERAWSQTQSQQYVAAAASGTLVSRCGSIHDHGLGYVPATGTGVTKRFFKAAADDAALPTTVKDKLFFQLQASRTRQFELAQQRYAAATGPAVPLYRSYRAGELPDIQIPRADVLRPLLAVAALHAQTASRLLCALLEAVLPRAPQAFATELAGGLTALLRAAPDEAVLVASVHACLATLLPAPVDAAVVGASSVASLNVVTGQRLLEEIVLHATREDVAGAWTQLQHVLQVADDEPLRMAAAVTATAGVPEATQALAAQLKGDVVSAQRLYGEAEAKLQAGERRTSPAERLRWATERLGCLAQLNKWDAVSTELLLSPDDVWGLPEPFREQQVRLLLLALGATDQVKAALLPMLTPDRRSYAARRFPELLGFLELAGPTPHDAVATTEGFFADCLSQWTALPPCYQLRQLQRLPLLAHLEAVLAVRCAADVGPCLRQWQVVQPLPDDDELSVWATHFWSRGLAYDRLKELAGDWGGLPQLEHDVAAVRVQDMLTFAHAAVAANVLALGSRLLSDYRNTCTATGLPKLSVRMVTVYVAQVTKLATRTLEQALLEPAPAKGLAQVAAYYASMLRLFDNDEVAALLPSLPNADQREVHGLHVQALASAASFHRRYGDAARGRQLAADALELFAAQRRPGGLAAAHGAFLAFLDKGLEDDAADEGLARAFVESVLHGMIMADEASATYLPRVLDLAKAQPGLLPLLTERWDQVPTWTCLHWSAQIVALLSAAQAATPFDEFVVRLLEQMATEYPRALYYDFRLTTESMAARPPRLDRLAALVNDAAMDQFVAALNGLHHPEIRFKEGLRQLADALESQPPAAIEGMARALLANVLDGHGDVLGQGHVGAYNRAWAKTHRKEVEGFFAKPLTKAMLAQARAWVTKVFQVMPGKFGIDRQWRAKLADFSEWLARLDPVKTRLELPGQYTARWAPPEPATHTTLLSCDPQLLVLASKQLPKRLALHASNGRTYHFLVKGGEDLRLDQRIEQLFEVINTALRSHASCRRRRDLVIRTYKVVPMTQKIGLVEWVSNTVTLKSVLEDEMRREAATTTKKKAAAFQLLSSPSGEKYEAFWSKQPAKLSYGHKVATVAATDVVAAFEAAQALLPDGLFRRRLVRMAATPEAFFQLRGTFHGTLAAFNGAGYLLGIGDRHLDNFLLDTTTGAVVGIDFGISFGAGASLLPVPELVPFRFTRQLQGVLAPYDGCHLLAHDLARVFEAVRDNQQRIDSVMNVFLHEPLLEWQGATKAQKKERKRAARTAGADTVDLPRVKMAAARAKIQGVPPTRVVLDELRLNAHVAAVLPALEKVLYAPAPATVLSPLDQAQALIELATDPNVLGRMFHGWSPWA
ncbi:DNA-dependent protein kinase catalytic subunit [Achlya hypogyna]|uniref:DNA-dependent protein kinase catalytic subunit n=1 Tax=Achlya hypogyna TaxID=1202772 RepID=A0A1V9Z2S5_ACHHY|nr:DNA-dependent protein kinase catalytic subunit [Achlya hypogyna]